MGGRGASSGISSADNKGGGKKEYGSQYQTLLTDGNVKFVQKNDRNSETLFETRTRGRVYVTVGGKDLLQVTYFDKQNKRNKTIDLSHFHAGMNPHVHHGYNHNEFDGTKGATRLSKKEMEMVERIRKIWYNYLSRR